MLCTQQRPYMFHIFGCIQLYGYEMALPVFHTFKRVNHTSATLIALTTRAVTASKFFFYMLRHLVDSMHVARVVWQCNSNHYRVVIACFTDPIHSDDKAVYTQAVESRASAPDNLMIDLVFIVIGYRKIESVLHFFRKAAERVHPICLRRHARNF